MSNAHFMFGTRWTAALAVVLMLSACASEYAPPPGYKGGYLWDSDKSRQITVEEGDTIYSIAQRYDVPVKVIIARNALRPPYRLVVGQSLILDPARMHEVARGESISLIARKYGIEYSLIAESNDLRPPYTIYPGQQLWIPDPFTVAAATSGAPPAAGPGATARMQATIGGAPASVMMSPSRTTGISPGISPGISVETLQPPPGAEMSPTVGEVTAPPDSVAPPAYAQAPVPAPAPASDIPALAQAPAIATAPAVPMTEPVAPPAASAPPVAAPTQLAALPPSPTATPPVSEIPARAARFIWPVKGRLVAGFGPAGKGLHNDGINIAAPVGTPVRAVDNGVVAYAGSELKGFGNLLLIKHADNVTTAYAHNDKLLVSKGDTVRQGQVVATVGKTGNVDAAQLHFEVRQGTQAVDPHLFLQQAAR